MKKLLLFVVLACTMIAPGCTMTETAAERDRRLVSELELNSKSMVEDWDYLWLADRNSMLSQWHANVGY